MAAISITVSETSGLFSISIDSNDWETFLTVIDGDNPPNQIPRNASGTTTYSQKEPQLLEFSISAEPNTVQAVNQGLIMVLAGKSSNYMCTVVYAGDGTTSSPFTLTCVCQEVGQNFTPTGSSSVSFTQTGMSGSFSTTA